MGLDMYLTKEVYLWGDEKKKLKITGIPGIKTDRVTNITEEAMYWRKANAIHKWFVNNVQDGEDDCQKYDVSIKQLKELLKLVRKVLREPDKASELLPSSSGCFFGDTGYDNNYIQDLKNTEKGLIELINEPGCEKFSYTYQSSW